MSGIFKLLSPEQREELYLLWINNFLTIERFAEYYGTEIDHTTSFIQTMRNTYNSKITKRVGK